jgi:hypothetical protein
MTDDPLANELRRRKVELLTRHKSGTASAARPNQEGARTTEIKRRRRMNLHKSVQPTERELEAWDTHIAAEMPAREYDTVSSDLVQFERELADLTESMREIERSVKRALVDFHNRLEAVERDVADHEERMQAAGLDHWRG